MPASILSRRSAVTALLVLTLLSGVVHGVLDGRWAAQDDKAAVGEELRDLPDTLGKWTLVEDGDLDEQSQQMLRCYGSFKNVYRHEATKSLVNVAVIYGPRGPTAVHRPEICYTSEGTKQTRSRMVESIETANATHQFWSVEFTNEDDPSSKFEVWYGFTSGDEWVAAEYPRFWLTDDLYKIQLSGPSTQSSFNPCKSLLAELLPHLEKQIK